MSPKTNLSLLTYVDYTFTVYGPPIPEKRPLFVHKDRNGKALPFVKVINRQEDEQAKFKWDAMADLMKSGTGLYIHEEGPIAMGLTFIMPIPKGWPQYKIRDVGRGVNFYHFSKPDSDNLVKFVMDCLEGICYKNDSQIATMDPAPVKIYGFEPKTIIRIRTLPEYVGGPLNRG